MNCWRAVRAPSSKKSTAVSEDARQIGLRGVRVLVTRPAHQAEPLVRLIERAGGEAVRLPTIEIVPPANSAAWQSILDRLNDFDFAIFVSRNAVQQALPAMRTHGLPPGLRLAAVGSGTAGMLTEAGLAPALVPAGRFDSEALLELMPDSLVRGKKILIVRGEGGRELLATSLHARGAQVTLAECYRRALPPAPDAGALERMRRGEIDIMVVTSGEGLRNLVALAGDSARTRLFATPLLTVSARQAAVARELGFHAECGVAAQASDAAVLDALHAWRARQISL